MIEEEPSVESAAPVEIQKLEKRALFKILMDQVDKITLKDNDHELIDEAI